MWLGHHHRGTEVYGGSLNPGSSQQLFDSIAPGKGEHFTRTLILPLLEKPEQDATGKWVNPYNLYAKWIHKP